MLTKAIIKQLKDTIPYYEKPTNKNGAILLGYSYDISSGIPEEISDRLLDMSLFEHEKTIQELFPNTLIGTSRYEALLNLLALVGDIGKLCTDAQIVKANTGDYKPLVTAIVGYTKDNQDLSTLEEKALLTLAYQIDTNTLLLPYDE